MRNILQAFIFWLLIFNIASASDFREVKEIVLKKDEQTKILVKYDNKEKVLKLRWTLYKNGGLVIFRSYDTVVAQNILYLRHENQSFRVDLKPASVGFYIKPYLLVMFKEFNHETSEASLELLLSDGAGTVNLEYEKKD